jgi:hypothetical protein
MSEASDEFPVEERTRRVELEVVTDYETGSLLVARMAQGVAEWADGRPLDVSRSGSASP